MDILLFIAGFVLILCGFLIYLLVFGSRKDSNTNIRNINE